MENTKINFMKFKSFGFGLSSVLAFGSIIILLMGVNLGIDFKGGTLIEVRLESSDNSVSKVRDAFNNSNLPNLSVKNFGNNKDYIIKFRY